MSIKEFMEETEKVERSFDMMMEAMSGAEIGRELNISRAAVSNTLKRAMKKMFMEFRKLDKSWNSFDVALAMATGMNDLMEDEVELKKFFKLFPPDIRKMIENDAQERMAGRKQSM